MSSGEALSAMEKLCLANFLKRLKRFLQIALISSVTKLPFDFLQCHILQLIASVQFSKQIKVVGILIADVANQPNLANLLESVDFVLFRQLQEFQDNVCIEAFEPSVVDEMKKFLENVLGNVAECANAGAALVEIGRREHFEENRALSWKQKRLGKRVKGASKSYQRRSPCAPEILALQH